MTDRQLKEARPSEQCGCPEELWLVGNLEVTIHLEEDGSGHIIADAGDWQIEREVETSGIVDLRTQAFALIDSLPEEDANG